METIETAAMIADHDGKCYSLPRPNRHHNIIWMLASLGFPTPVDGEQGFTTSEGRFVDRIEAGEIAIKSGQISELCCASGLFSEDLW